MLLKTIMDRTMCIVLLAFLALPLLAEKPFLNQENPSLFVDFDACVSFFGGYNEDYSEFTPDVVANDQCSGLTMLGGSVYRLNTSVNTHSCAPGVDSLSMCISGDDACDFTPDSDMALRFDIEVTPGPNGFGSIENISFFEQAPEMFNFHDGPTGVNNYPTLLAVRVTVDSTEIFLQEDIQTSRTWAYRIFDFSGVQEFRVSDTTVFHFEILPYCTVGNGSSIKAWDIDNLEIVGGCNEVDGGIISTTQANSICYADGDTTVINFDLIENKGPNDSWLVANELGIIELISDTSAIDFDTLDNGLFTVYHLSFETDFSGLEVGASLADLEGCFDLSNGLLILNNKLESGTISIEGSDSIYYICTEDSLSNIFFVDITGQVGTVINYVLTDTSGTILQAGPSNNFNLNSFSEGSYFVQALVHNGELFNAVQGMNINDVTGCFMSSNTVEVNVSFIDAGEISVDGNNNIIACESSGLDISPELIGNIGNNGQWIVATTTGMIIIVQDSLPLDISIMNFDAVLIFHIVSLGPLDGLASGEMLADIGGCFDLSNPIQVSLPNVDGGVSTINGSSDIAVCVNETSSLTVDVESQEGSFFNYIVTDTTGLILDVTAVNSIDISSAGPGLCQVWHIAYESGLSGLMVGNNVSDIEGCFDISNPVNVDRIELEAGTLELEDGSTSVTICSGDGENDNLVFVTDSVSAPFETFLITDDSGNLITTSSSDTINFEGVEQGICFVYYLVAADSSIIQSEINVDSLAGCFAISNAVSVTRNQVVGGDLFIVDSLLTVQVVVGDGLPDPVDFDLTNAVGDSMAFIITNNTGVILDITNDTTVDFESAGQGNCLVYNISYTGAVSNLIVGENIEDLEGCFNLSNSVTVERIVLDGGNIALLGGATTIEICTGDAEVDNIVVDLNDEMGPNFDWLVTDTSGQILVVQNSSVFTFDDVPSGECLIWHIAYTDNLTGLVVGENVDDLGQFFDLSNSISVIRSQVDGGSIITSDSLTVIDVIVGDGIDENIIVDLTGAIGDTMVWLITDSVGTIVALPDGPPFNFEEAGEGVCFIWNLSYNDNITGLEVDANVSDLEGCFALSNSIQVNRTLLEGGVIEFDGLTSPVEICTGDADIDTLSVLLNDASGPNMEWVITDTTGFIIITQDSSEFVFNNAVSGECLIWHISYETGLTGLEPGENVANLMGSFSLSNSLSVIRTQVDGGEIIGTDGQDMYFVCSGDGENDPIDVDLSGTMGDVDQWVITDDSGIVLELPMAPPFDFEGVAPGICFIYNIAYINGLEGLEVGSSIDSLEGCYEFSNAIEVVRDQVAGGILTTSTGEDSITIVIGDVVVDSIDLNLVDAAGNVMQYVITDTTGVILENNAMTPLTFENAGSGTCLVYNISYSMMIFGLEVGDTLSNVTGCFDLSNPVTVFREEINAGTIMTPDSLTMLDLCIIDMDTTEVDVVLEGVIADTTAWVITDDLGNVLELPSGPPFDFGPAPTGICQIWHLAGLGSISGLNVGGNVSDIMGTYGLSNPIVVNRDAVSGGTLLTTNSQDSVTIVVNDGIADTINVILTGAVGDSIDWVITNEMGIIVGLPDLPPFDLEGTEPGQCQIWALLSNNDVDGLELNNPVSELSGCFDLSNPITVTRNGISGGSIMTIDSLTSVEVCLSDMIADSIDVVLDSNFGTNSAWVITDTSGLILDLPMSPPFDFTNTPVGICQIWHLSHEDNLTGLELMNNVSDLMGSFDFSNPIEVLRDSVSGGQLEFENGLTSDTIMVDDNLIDTLIVELSDAIGDLTQYLVTDTEGNILELPTSDTLIFGTVEAGICQVWNISAFDGLTGLEVGNNVSDLVGCFDLSNPLTIVRLGLMGGNLSSIDGLTSVSYCVGDGIADTLLVNLTDTLGPEYAWIITDTAGVILDLPVSDTFEFDNAGLGICQLWNISFEPGLEGLVIGENVDTLMGSFDFSNPIIINRTSSEGGSIMTSDSLNAITINVGEGITDSIDVILTGNSGDNSAWVITDTTGVIQALPAAPPFDFENAGGGVCQIWHLSYADEIMGLTVGENIDTLMGCFDFSDSIEVTRIPTILQGGVLTTIDGLSEVEICAGDGNPDPISIDISQNQGPNQSWVITDTTGLILGLPTAPPFDLDLAGAGVCQIWNLAYSNGLQGLEVNENVNDLVGFFDFSTPIVVIRTSVNGGELVTTNDETEVSIIVGDGIIDSIDVVLTNIEGDTTSWVITNEAGVIVELPMAPPFTFEDAGNGVCQIWNISYAFGLTGLQVGQSVANITGCYELSNPITVNRQGLDAGVVADADGLTETTLCFNGTIPDSITLTLTDTFGTFHQWMITDDMGIILELPTSQPFGFDNAPAGICFIYNVAYDTLPMNLVAGDTLANVTGTFELSNPYTVFREFIDGGSLTFDNGMLLDSIEVGEGVIDSINVDLSGALGGIQQYVVTDTFGNIMALPLAPPFDFENMGGGTCQIWNITYLSGLTGLSVGSNVSQLDGCFDFSNPITLFREGLSGGLLTFDDGTFTMNTCFGDDIDDPTDVIVQGVQGAESQLFVATTAGQILFNDIITPFNFENVPLIRDTFIIYNIAYDTIPDGLGGNGFINNLDGTFALSNPIFLLRESVSGGDVVDDLGVMARTIIVGDGQPDTLNLILTNEVGDSTSWVITDAMNIITGFSDTSSYIFTDSEPEGEMLYWHIGFDPSMTTGLEIGESIDSIAGCFDISNNFTLTKKLLNGGTISLANGDTDASICFGEGVDDILNFVRTGELGTNFSYLVVNTTGIIELAQDNAQINFEDLGPGIFEVFSVSHDGSLDNQIMEGTNINNFTGCFLFSNSVMVTSEAVFGGTLTFTGGGTTQSICAGDDVDDILMWNTTNQFMNYAYAITDTLNVIDTVIVNGLFNFDNQTEQECRVWGISFTGNLTAMAGDTVGVSTLTDGCIDISSNNLVVTKDDCPQPAGQFNFDVYPNPVVDFLTIDIKDYQSEMSTIKLVDGFGKVIYNQEHSSAETVRIDLNNFDQGVYILQIKSGPKIKSDKVLIVR